jgi:hypothetical protein
MTLRAVDIEAGKNGAGVVVLKVCTAVGLYILNHKRAYLQSLLERRGLNVIVQIDDSLGQGQGLGGCGSCVFSGDRGRGYRHGVRTALLDQPDYARVH